MARFTPARGETIAWHYDVNGMMLGFELNGIPYFYVRDLQGDVVAILDVDGNVVAEYAYDAWGNILSAEGVLAYVNPITYRGYYWDWTTGLYYLQSRYYDPMLRRFISADVFMDTGVGILGTNMYIYANNNPVMFVDPTGYSPLGIMRNWVTDTASSLWNRRGDIVDTYVKLFHEWLDDEIALLEQEWARQQATLHHEELVFEFTLQPDQIDSFLNFLDIMSNQGLGIAVAVCLLALTPLVAKFVPQLAKPLTRFGIAAIFTPAVAESMATDIRNMDYSGGVTIRIDMNVGAPTFTVDPPLLSQGGRNW
ncbi:MAG: RHS repeat-associated core domain-containing protein [Oscillospiraceae bacterium]|nr:RHS repeat-associated core domain-containing protein [Oscillospiraceae bacterium]